MRQLVRLLLLVAIAVWLWRLLLARREPDERAGISYADGSAFVLEPGSPAFGRLAAIARGALQT
jgi:hypothetical protein